MKKTLAIGLLTVLSAVPAAQAGRPAQTDVKTYTQALSERSRAADRLWRHASDHSAAAAKAPAHVITTTDQQTAPVSFWGTLSIPSGEEWMYTADYSYSPTESGTENISGADITIYTADFKVYSTFHASFELGEHETGINTVELVPTLTKKFFNINDAYEVMIMVHATTDDYAGHIYTQVYTLSDGSLVTTIEGNNISAVDCATDSWSENFAMVFMREEMTITDEDYSYGLFFDVYSKAGWSTGCKLEHTFDVDYQLIAGAGNYALPILVNKHKGKMYYALPRYEKPYFVDSYSEDITPDNHFIIDLYDNAFNLLHTTSIPMELEGDAPFTFPGMGELFGNADLSFGLFSDDDTPHYIIGMENYVPGSDEFTTSLYVYNIEGQRLKTIATSVGDYLQMAPVAGQPAQFCFYYPASDLGYFSMVDIPSCTERAFIPLRLGEGEEAPNITTSIDRVASGNSYKYVSSLAAADVNDRGDALHRFAWYNADGSFDRFDTVNLGQDIALGMPNVSGEALNPYLFNTDSAIEYMFLVKKYRNISQTTATDEIFRIYGANDEVLLELGPDPVTGEVLNAIFIHNAGTDKPKLVITYYKWQTGTYTVRHIDLPLSKFKGEGTVLNPYLIETPGDMMAMYLYPSSCFRLAADIDFGGYSWSGTTATFTGTLDGAGHTVTNLNLTGSIFENFVGKATVKDLKFKDLTFSTKEEGGVIAANMMGDGTNGPAISNVHIEGLVVDCQAQLVGGLAGMATGRASISASSVQGDFDCPRGTMGGIVGRVTTGTTIEACCFDGTIKAASAAGICGESYTGDETIANCHVNADIDASYVAAGIIGESKRTFVHHCLVEGSVKATGSRQAYAGGIVGSMESTFEPVEAPVVYNNITCAAVSANPAASECIAHRVAGFTSGDEMLVNWDSTDPSVDWSDPSTYPYYKGDPEKALADNYALGVALIDADVADAANTPEGASIESAPAEWLTAQGWLTGSTVDAPWMSGGKVLVLWYETGSTGITPATVARPTLTVERGILKADGEIVVYSVSGAEVARGNGQISTDRLPRGVYVATSRDAKVKFVVR